MKVVSCADVGKDPEKERVFTVELEKARYVDIKYIPRTGLVYIMQNEDGSEVYDPENWGVTYPDYNLDENKVLEVVRDSCFK